MPSDKFVKNDDPNVYHVQGFSLGFATGEQEGQGDAIVAALMCHNKGSIMVVFPMTAIDDFVDHILVAKDVYNKKKHGAAPSPLSVIEGDKK